MKSTNIILGLMLVMIVIGFLVIVPEYWEKRQERQERIERERTSHSLQKGQ